MKILRIIDRMNIGGPAIHVLLLGRHFNPGGSRGSWETVLVTGAEGESEGSLRDRARGMGLRLEYVPSLGRELDPLRDLAALCSLIRLIRRERPAIVHTHKSKAGALGRLAAWLCGVPVRVHTFHGHVLHGYFGETKSRVFVWMERALARLSQRIIAVSPRVREDLLLYDVAPPERIEVVPLGLDLARFASKERNAGSLRSELGLAADVPLVGIVARLAPVKDIPAFLAAARLVLGRVPEAHFAVIGDGELRHGLEEHARGSGLGERVHFTGFRDCLEDVYADLDVLTLTSRNEGSPVSLIEGLAAGCAVAAMDVGGVRDVVRDGATGVLTPGGDPEALADAIVALLQDPDKRRRLSSAGREDVLSRYSVERLVRDLESLYGDLL